MEFNLDDPQQAMIVALRTSNTERVGILRAQGVGIQQDRTLPVVEFLLDLLAGQSPERIEFERMHAQGIADQLDDIDRKILEQRLREGVPVKAPPQGILRSVQR